MPHPENDPAAIVDAARSLQLSLEASDLHVVNSRSRFDTRISSDGATMNLPISMAEKSSLVDPASVTADVAAQLAFFRKLKFQYLEQKAKDQYIKTIVSDDAPNITAADNEGLRQTNERKKQELKVVKQKLSEAYNNIHALSPMVEQDLNRANTLTFEAATLAQQILDARLRLNRLHQTHPQPRLTVTSAESELERREKEMQKFEEQLQNLNESIDKVKGKVKDGARDVERLRVERADVEKQAKASKNEAEDGRFVGLYDWYIASLGLHKTCFALKSFQSPSENELCLTYDLPAADAGIRSVTVTLLFVPNTRKLADARVEGLRVEAGDVVGAHVQSNDVPGLITSLLSRASAEFKPGLR